MNISMQCQSHSYRTFATMLSLSHSPPKKLCYVIVVIVLSVIIVIEKDSGDNCLLACDAMCFGKLLHVFWRNLVPKS